MTARVKDQENLIDRLKSEGGDVSREIERLLLMRRALEEMLLYLPGMIPTDDPAPPRAGEVEQTFLRRLKDRQERGKPRRR
jgi:hypothetical protein